MLGNGVINEIRAELNRYFKERKEVIDAILLGILSGQNVFLLGAPGTAKTAIARAVVSHIEGAKFFYCLLTPFTTPDDLFGPIDVLALEKGEYRRKTTGKLPEADLVFLDEIFKATTVLNALLSILNERILNLDGNIIDIPALTVITASNEVPEDDSLRALYDRLLIRVHVEPIRDARNFIDMLTLEDEYAPKTTIPFDYIKKLRAKVKKVPIPDEVIENVLKIKLDLEDENIFASDRRYKLAMSVMRANAVLNGRSTVTNEDILVLRYILWDEPDQISTVTDVISRYADVEAQKIVEAEEILKDISKKVYALPEGATVDANDLLLKLDNLAREVKDIQDDRVKDILKRINELKKVIIHEKLGIELD